MLKREKQIGGPKDEYANEGEADGLKQTDLDGKRRR